MKISDLLKPDGIMLHASLNTKEEILEHLITLHKKVGNLKNPAEYKKDILARERKSSTAVGSGIAIPHAKSSGVKKAGLTMMTLGTGIDYGSPDGRQSDLFFMIAAPSEGNDVHLEALSRLTMLLVSEEISTKLRLATSPEEVLAILDHAEREKLKEEKHIEKGARILAVTACPTGIAHTFMAAENLERAAKEMGISIKVEASGSGGAKNPLTAEEIKKADAIIVAADRKVETDRFHGKKVLFTKVADGIHKPKELIERAIAGNVPIYEGSGSHTSSEGHEHAGRKVYKYLMNGVSHMLPFVTGGGILIALAFLLDDYEINPAGFGSNTPLAAFFKTIGDLAFSMMLPILSGYIASAIADRPGLAPGFVGGLLASSGASFGNLSGGVSAGFLGALFAGFAAGFIVLFLQKIFGHLPHSVEGIKPVLLYPLLGILLIGLLMCLVNPFVSMLNTGLNNFLSALGSGSRILLGVVLGGMMSIDMGGPFNKAAYVFGTASIAGGNFDIMAAVMVGGMIPPLAIALCTSFFPYLWSEKEKKSGLVNYIMGLCFITEGAIPFAAADPLRVIPSCIAGSALAGGLSMAFGCTLRAPHGGIFVLPVIGNILGYLIALVAGSVLSMLLLAAFRRRKGVPND